LGIKQDVFAPQFPASCPYLTAVGSTFLPPGANAAIDAEISTTRFPSGGGFSNIYGTAFYQAGSVAKYFAENNPPYKFYESIDNSSFNAGGGIYNRIGRGYPDVAAIGDFVVVYIGGARGRIGGTSASSPAFASIITRINEERLAIGKSPVGFINPVLVSNDIPAIFEHKCTRVHSR
jgi:tripeptidyl-peptidase-1